MVDQLRTLGVRLMARESLLSDTYGAEPFLHAFLNTQMRRGIKV